MEKVYDKNVLFSYIREDNIFGILHNRPRDGEFGDAIPFFYDGIYHVFFLYYRKNHNTKWGHIISQDIIYWYSLPDAIVPGPNEYDANDCLTGSVIEKNGLFHIFYTGSGNHKQTICHAISADLIKWTKDTSNPIIISDARWYGKADWRDPLVISNPNGCGYWMLIGTRTNNTDGIYPYNSCVALAESDDLENWKVLAPFAECGIMYMDCPDLFKMNDKWVLLLASRETAARIADSPEGPWTKVLRESPDTIWGMAGKTLYDGSRRLIFPFLLGERKKDSNGNDTFACTLLIPREFYLDDDNVPYVRCPQEIYYLFKNSIKGWHNNFILDSHAWRQESESLFIYIPNESAMVYHEKTPVDFIFSAQIILSEHEANAGIMFRTKRSIGSDGSQTIYDPGWIVLFQPDRYSISCRPINQWDNMLTTCSMGFKNESGKPIVILLIIHGRIMELFVDKQRALAADIGESVHHGFGLIARNGEVAFKNMKIVSLEQMSLK